MRNFGDFLLENLSGIAVVSTAIVAFTYVIIETITHKKEKTEILNSFSETVKQLASDNSESQLSAAILLRRFINVKLGFRGKFLYDETINVISSLLRTLPTGIYQKTLGDGLAYAADLSEKDLQKTNLQDLYLGNKTCKIIMRKTDMYMSDLSYALLQNIDGNGIIFYNAILLCTVIKDCDFTNANFNGADLTNVKMKNVLLTGASFNNASGVPEIIKEKLEDGIFKGEQPITTSQKEDAKTIFFSMPGVMTKYDEVITKEYKRLLESKGYDVIYYIKDDYPKFGQFNKVKESINRSSGVIAFGFKQLNIVDGVLRPHTNNELNLSSKWLTTPWTDIEVGMALMTKLPILLVHDTDITDGVFDDNLNECFVGKISTEIDIRRIERNPVFENWINKVYNPT